MNLLEKLFSLSWSKKAWYTTLRLTASVSPTVPEPNPECRWSVWGRNNPSTLPKLPKIIWTYWSGPRSITAEACFRSWNKHCDGFSINAITKGTLRDFLDNFPPIARDLPEQKVSNLIRLMLLERYGGIWMDYSTLLTSPITWTTKALDHHRADVLAFYNEHPDEYRHDPARPVIENGFLAARPGSKFISRWREIYQECIQSDDYKSHFIKLGEFSTLTQNFISKDPDNLGYFVCYIAAQKTMLESDGYRLLLLNCEDEYYHTYYNTSPPRNKRRFAEELLLKDYRSTTPPRIIKITGGHRLRVDEHVEHMAYRANSLLGNYL